MEEFIKLTKGFVAIGIFIGVFTNLAYILGMVAGLLNLFYGTFCYLGVSGIAIGNVINATTVLLYSSLIIYLYRTFYGS